MTHSPFHVVENFISPLQCEKLVSALALTRPDYYENGQPLKHERHVPVELSTSIMNELEDIKGDIEARYSGTLSDQHLLFQQYWEDTKSPAEGMWCESSKFVRKKWSKIKNVDLVGFIWLKDFHNSVPLDPRFEVYGGKLEFPGYNFSLTPVRGTLVLFPATPHFVTAISHVMLGSLEQIKITARLTWHEAPWQYVPAHYPGTYQEWFFDETK